MFNQIRQKKKKDAVRRLSQSRGGHHNFAGPFRGVANSRPKPMKRSFHSSLTNPSEEKSLKRYISPLADVTSGSTPSPKEFSGIHQTSITNSGSVFGSENAVFDQTQAFGIHSFKEANAGVVQETSGNSVSPLVSLTTSTNSNGTKSESRIFGETNLGQPFGAKVKQFSGELNSDFGFSSQSVFGAAKNDSFTTPIFGNAPSTTAQFGSSQFGIGTESKCLQPDFGMTTKTSTTLAGSFVNTMKPVPFSPLKTPNSSTTGTLGEVKEKSAFNSGPQGSQLSPVAGSMPLKFGFDAALSSGCFSSVGTSRAKDPTEGASVTKNVFCSVLSSEPKIPFGTLSENQSAAKVKVRVSEAKSVISDTKLKSPGNKDFSITASINGGKRAFGQTNKISENRSLEEKEFKADISKNTSLVIREIPDVFNRNQCLKRFYSRFGEVIKVLCYPNKKSATISFKKHEEAQLAKRKGKYLKPGLPPVVIFWKQIRSRSRTLSDTELVKTEDASHQFMGVVPAAVSSKKETKNSAEANIRSQNSQQSRLRKIFQELEPSSFPSSSTAGEKFDVLDSVDKKIRQGITRSSDITTAEATRGTCPDMCPEKERYMREDRRRLSIFEIIPGTDGSLEENPLVDHSRAVKEYSGSAADKLEPLPHELRPVSVLKMTMDYLATSIMDASNDRWAEWFDFLWNRTRGIRKDITQQHLCDPDCVDLVEKTARFHIFCSHALCEQEMSAFDPKINNENLTKCLQTLKQFYNDLYQEKNVVCPNEAEFRGYDVLLNLNEGDTLRQIMHLRKDIQNSKEVKFALDVFYSLNNSNYAKFFKLLRSATYLNGCIMHRYFTQLRSTALRTMNYSLSVSSRTTEFPIRNLVELLAFESEEEAFSFCVMYALDANDQTVQFSRTTLIEPEEKPPHKIAKRLIESKRKCSIGEIVYGSMLPPPPNHLPKSSFDENGRFVCQLNLLTNLGEDEDAEVGTDELHPLVKDQQACFPVPGFGSFKQTQPGGNFVNVVPSGHTMFGQLSAVPGQTSVFPSGRPEQSQQLDQDIPNKAPFLNNEVVKQLTKSLFIDVIDEMVAEISQAMVSEVQKYLVFIEIVANELMMAVTSQNIRAVAEITLEKEQQKWRAEVFKEKVSQMIYSDIMEEMVTNTCVKLAKQLNQEVKKQLVEQSKKVATERICKELVEESLHYSVNNLVRTAILEEKEKRHAALKAIGEAVVRTRLLFFFKKWRKACRAQMHLKRLLREFPCMPPLYTDSELMERLLSESSGLCARQKSVLDGYVVLPESNEERHEKFNKVMRKNQEDLQIVRNEVFRPVDVPLVLAESLRTRRKVHKESVDSTIFWKLLVSFPSNCDSPSRKAVRLQGLAITPGLIREKLKRGINSQESDFPASLKDKLELLSLYKAEVRQRQSQVLRLGVCIKASYGVLSNTQMHEVQDNCQFLGTSAVLFVITEEELNNKEAAVRLRRLLRSKPPVPRLPVVVMILGRRSNHRSLDDVLIRLGLHNLQQENLVSDYKALFLTIAPQVSYLEEKIMEAVTWLSEHSKDDLGITSTRLIDYIEEAVAMHFTSSVYDDLNIRKKAGLDQQCPEAVVDLYHGVLDHLAAVMTSQHLCNVSWPVQEFSRDENGLPKVMWNTPSMLRNLAEDKLLSLKLPPLPPAADDGTWDSECKLCFEFASNIVLGSSFLLSRVDRILNGTRRSLEELNFLSSEPRLSASQVPWPEILDACVHCMLTSLHEDPSYLQIYVHYFEDDLNKFTPPTLWSKSANESRAETFMVLERKKREAQKPTKSRIDKLHESFLEVEEDLTGILELIHMKQESPLCNQELPSDFVDTRNNIMKELEHSKAQSHRFDELLEKSQIEEEISPLVSIFSVRQKRKSEVLRAEKKVRIHADHDCPSSEHDVSVDSLERTLQSLQDSVQSFRRADSVAELKLKSFLET